MEGLSWFIVFPEGKSDQGMMNMNQNNIMAIFAAAGAACIAAPAPALAQEKTFDIPAQPATTGIPEFARQADIQILVGEAAVRGKHTRAVKGRMAVSQALETLLAGTGLRMMSNDEGVITLMVNASYSQPELPAERETASLQTPASEQSARNEAVPEIIVTAQKREQRLTSVPMSIGVLSGDMIAQQRITNLLDISRAVPGMVVSDSGPGRRRLNLRGVGNTFGAQPLVGLYLDETSVAGFNDSVINLQTYDLERVEVLRGPQGTLYGEGSTSGTVRFITSKPQLDGYGLDANLKGFAPEGGDVGADLTAAVNIPLAEDVLGLRVSGRYLKDRGWMDQPALGLENINDQSLVDLRFQLRWQVTDNFTADAMAIIHRNDAGASNRGEDINGDFTQAFMDPSTPSAKDEFNIYNLTLNYDFGPVSLISATSYVDMNKRLRNDGNTIPLLAPPAPLFQFLNRVQDSDGATFSQEVRATSSTGGPLQYTLGVYYRDSQLDRYSESLFGLTLPAASFFESTADNGSKSWAVFGDISYELTSRLEIGGGLRYFVDKRENFNGVSKSEADFETVNPRFYVSFDLTDTATIYGNIAKGFRSGGFNRPGQDPYDPETLWSYEIGAKADLFDRRLHVEGTAFYSDYSNIQVVGVTGTSLGQSITSNLGEAWVKGLEGTASFYVGNGLDIGATAAVYETKVTSLNVGSASHQVGDELDDVPDYSLSAWADYSFPIGRDLMGTLQASYGRKGVSYYRNRSVGPFFLSMSDVTDMLDLSFEVDRGQWSVLFFIDNALNERGQIDPFGIEGGAARPQPRTFGVGLGLSL